MTEAVSTETLNVKLNTLLEARAEDLAARKEDRARRDQERAEDRAMMHEMGSNISEMATAITIQTKNNEHLNQRVDGVEERQGVQANEIKTIQNTQAGNAVRWQVLIAGLAAFVTLGGIFLTAFLWVADKLLG